MRPTSAVIHMSKENNATKQKLLTAKTFSRSQNCTFTFFWRGSYFSIKNAPRGEFSWPMMFYLHELLSLNFYNDLFVFFHASTDLKSKFMLVSAQNEKLNRFKFRQKRSIKF